MEIEFDPDKSAKNDKQCGLPFERAAELEWDSALAVADDRHYYGGQRIVALAPMQGRLYVVCYVMRGQVRRIISFRKANKREERAYEQAITDRSKRRGPRTDRRRLQGHAPDCRR
ncbi:BrnT family toxin [Rhodopila sp.]|uniref:BrnT family toxin n=1 Tax=Rhodopila sp. TaxID=2480087 RepID=UPI003D0D2456